MQILNRFHHLCETTSTISLMKMNNIQVKELGHVFRKLCGHVYGMRYYFLLIHSFSGRFWPQKIELEWNQQRDSFPHKNSPRLDRKHTGASFSCLQTIQTQFAQNNKLKLEPLKNTYTYWNHCAGLKRTLPDTVLC